MKTKVSVLLFCFACQISFAQTGTWPVDPGYVYFGANEMNQANAGNYSLLQEKSNGRTFLNSPLDIRFRIGNSEHMILSGSGYFGFGTVSPSNWFPGKVFEVADIRPTLKLNSTAPTGMSTIVFTNSGVNSSTHVGEFHLNYQFNQANNNKSAIRFAGYPAGDIFTMHADGNVGIGTTNPLNKLHVNSSALVDRIAIQGALGNSNLGFMIVNQDGTERWSMASVYDRDYLQFYRPGYGNVMVLRDNGNVGIGTSSPNEKLTVNGTIYGKEVKVDLSVPAPDYVFDKEYNLPSLAELKAYIERYKHLPEVPSAKDMEKKGINVGEMNMLLLKKMEELTLYVIQLKEENIKQDSLIQEFQDRVKGQEQMIHELRNK